MRRVSWIPVFFLFLWSPAFGGVYPAFQQNGNLGLEVTGVAAGNNQVFSGNLTLSNIPPSAVVLKATLYASQVNNGNGLDAVFGQTNLGTVGPTGIDMAFITAYSYHWDVTNIIIPTQTTYSVTIGQNTMGQSVIAGVALAVIWQDASEPFREVVLYDGMQQVGESGPETESVTFSGLPAGSTTAWVFTVFDDNSSTGEVVAYNGNGIGGPIDGNLGLNASLLQLSATSLSGMNRLSITTGTDHMGWMIAGVAVDYPPVPAKPTSWSALKTSYRR